MIGIEIGYETNKLFIIGCLLPSTNLPLEEYKQVMQDVFDLFGEQSEIDPVILCGDFNTDIKNSLGKLHMKEISVAYSHLTPSLRFKQR